MTALFEEEENGTAKDQVIISDGPSSIGTPSPINLNEMNHINNSNNKYYSTGSNYPKENGDVDIVITGQESGKFTDHFNIFSSVKWLMTKDIYYKLNLQVVLLLTSLARCIRLR